MTPATLRAWQRLVARKWDYANLRRPGRPSTVATIRKLVIRLATDNPAWGIAVCRANWSSWATRSPPPQCGRSRMLPGSIPRRAGRAPAWKQFLTAQARGILAVDFLVGLP